MYLLFSGEGPTDLGTCSIPAFPCTGEAFLPGPCAILVDQVVEAKYDYSLIDMHQCEYVSKHHLVTLAAEFKTAKKELRLPGKKRGKETRFFFNNARALAQVAIARQEDLKRDVTAVLFRDADGTASAGRGDWQDKVASMMDGFTEEAFGRGIPMLPKPRSEAWILCALKRPPQGGGAFEARSGNDDSPNSLKAELAQHLGEVPTRQLLHDLAKSHAIDASHISVPSFAAFRSRLEELL